MGRGSAGKNNIKSKNKKGAGKLTTTTIRNCTRARTHPCGRGSCRLGCPCTAAASWRALEKPPSEPGRSSIEDRVQALWAVCSLLLASRLLTSLQHGIGGLQYWQTGSRSVAFCRRRIALSARQHSLCEPSDRYSAVVTWASTVRTRRGTARRREIRNTSADSFVLELRSEVNVTVEGRQPQSGGFHHSLSRDTRGWRSYPFSRHP